MLRRAVITLISLAAILSAFLVHYHFNSEQIGARPEPEAFFDPKTEVQNNDGDDDVVLRVAPELDALFPDKSDWRRTAANIIVSTNREVFFLFKGQPRFSEDGKTLSLNACTAVYLPEKAQPDAKRKYAPVVFDSSDQLDLHFSKSISNFFKLDSLDLSPSSFLSGEMNGVVSVTSEMEIGTPDDDLYIQTRNVVFTLKQIYTTFDFSLQIGRNRGSGKGLTVDFDLPLRSGGRVKAANEKEEISPIDEALDDGNIGGGISLRSVVVNELNDYFRLYYDSIGNAPKLGNVDDDDENARAEDFIAVRSKKGLFFSTNRHEVGGWCVRFNKDVDLISFRDGEKSEQLSCDTLYLFLQDFELKELAEKSAAVREEIARKNPTGRLSRLKPTVARAIRGEDAPATVKIIGQNVDLTAGEIQYRILDHVLDLASDDATVPVRLVRYADAPSDAEEPSVDFSSSQIRVVLNERNELMQILANTNGALRLRLKDKENRARTVQAYWRSGLRITPETKRPDVLRAALSGDVSFNIEDLGVFAAKEANFWCRFVAEGEKQEESPVASEILETESSNEEYETGERGAPLRNIASLAPVGAKFNGDVSFQSSFCSATVKESATVRFDAAPPRVARIEETSASTDLSSGISRALQDGETKSFYEIDCQRLNLWCLLVDEVKGDVVKRGIDLYRILLLGGASFTERDAATRAENLHLEAYSAQIDRPNEVDARIRLQGADGATLFRMKELELVGQDVEVDRARNAFKVSGDGKLTIAPTEKARAEIDGNLSKFFTDEPIVVSWNDAMTFDGQTLSFKALENSRVSIAQGKQLLSCSEARVSIKNPVSLFDLNVKSQASLDVETIECLGSLERPVYAELREFEPGPNGSLQTRALYYAYLRNAKFNRSTGVFTAEQGGELFASVKSNGVPQVNPFEAAAETSAETKKTPSKPWTKIHAKFSQNLEGNLERRELVANKNVQVAILDVDDPTREFRVSGSSLPPGATFASCDKALLTMAQESPNARPTVDVKAYGNVLMRRDEYYGVCDVLTYSAGKNRATLVGESPAKVVITKKIGSGAPTETVGKFTRCDITLDPWKIDVEGAEF